MLKKQKIYMIALLILNSIMIASIVLLFTGYIRSYHQKLYEQNLNDISNINQASAAIASELYASQERKISNIQQYLSRNLITLDDVMEYIEDSNADNDVTFQLLGEDYNGYVVKKDDNNNFIEISYSNSDYKVIQKIVDSMHDENNEIAFTVEFTDKYSGSRSFARCVNIKASDNSGNENNYILMAVFKSSAFISHINLSGGFDDMSTVLINSDGRYVLRNEDFKSDNLFQYFYIYNNLSLDKKSEIQQKMISSDRQTLNCLNSNGEECVYVCVPVQGTEWHCVSCVPLTSFHETNFDIKFTVILILILATMMTVDLLYMAMLNKRLKISAMEANSANVAKTDFLSRMSHDIRTPINVINGMTALALMENNTDKTNEYLENINSSGKFLLGLVNDILDMNKVESGRMELHLKPYKYSEFLKYINAVILPLCKEKNIEFKLDGNADNIIMVADSLRLNQIFFNLLSNAVKFTAESGHIFLNCNTEKISDNRTAFDYIVSDDGVGMSMEFQKNMYGAFTQEERTESQNTNGTGLGLAIVKNLVNLMGGNISVHSAENKGTTFFIHLEFDTVVSEDIQTNQKNAEIDLAGKRILLCEDHPLNIKIMVQMLNHKSVDTDVAENGQIGADMFKNSPEGYYDAVLMDIRMPVMNGIESAKAIRAMKNRNDSATVPIIALTANAYDSDVQNCLDAGMNAHLAKPVDIQKLCEVLSCMISDKEKQK